MKQVKLPKIIKSPKALKKAIKEIKAKGKTVGLVPTMGYLHEGHLSLIRAARKECDFVVISIFINPTQFGPREDYARYPRDMKRDEYLAAKEGVDIIFTPGVKDIYPPGYATYVNVEGLGEVLCGASRPGHFKGVCTIVAKLFNIVGADVAYFGQKDAQQAIIISKMVKDLNVDVRVKILPTTREPDGLAMSSRNTYLSKGQRQQATVLFKALNEAKELIKAGEKNTSVIKKKMRAVIKTAPDARIDYVSIADIKNLKDVKKIKEDVLMAVAVFFGPTRLIDNTWGRSTGGHSTA